MVHRAGPLLISWFAGLNSLCLGCLWLGVGCLLWSCGRPLTCAFRPAPILRYAPKLKQFLATLQMAELHKVEEWMKFMKLEDLTSLDLVEIKRRGFSDSQIARCVGMQRGAGNS